jgi:hypothetical protein
MRTVLQLAAAMSRSPLPAVFLLCACASADPLGPASSRDFEYIAREEARLERASTALESGGCPERCASADDVCEASDAICGVARGTSDLDARDRCRSAERRCLRARAAEEACSCE